MIRLIPTLATILGITGAGTLIWYYNKPTSEREELDQKANELAQNLYQNNAHLLSATAVQKVVEEVTT